MFSVNTGSNQRHLEYNFADGHSIGVIAHHKATPEGTSNRRAFLGDLATARHIRAKVFQPSIKTLAFHHLSHSDAKRLDPARALTRVEFSGKVSAHGRNSVDTGELRKLCEKGRLDDALIATNLLHQQGKFIPTDIIYCILQLCIKKKDLKACRSVHSLIVNHGLTADTFWSDHLIRLFASCGNLLQANEVFCNVSKPSLYTWNAIISANAKLGNSKQALDLYFKMQHEGLKPDKYTFLGSLKACIIGGAVEEGRLIHEQVIASGLGSDVVLGNALIDMYTKCGSLEEGRELFDNFPCRDVVTWGAMITGYVQNGNGHQALELYKKMQQGGIEPDAVLISCMLKACGIIGDMKQGMLIHDQIMKNGFQSDVVVGNSLIDLYLKCGSVNEGRKVFDDLSKKDLVSWNAMIAGYTQHGNGLNALDLFEKMQTGAVKPDKATYSSIFKACGSIGDLELGASIHKKMMKSGVELDIVVKNALVDMYSKCGGLEEGLEVFNELSFRDVVSWNAVLAGYAEHGDGLPALELFKRMLHEGIKPDNVTFSSILKACGTIGALLQGRLIHERMMRMGLDFDAVLGISLVDMYAKCEGFEDARNLLNKPPIQNIEPWNALIAGYARHGTCTSVNQCLEEMQEHGLKPNCRTYTSVLAACSHAGQVEEGRKHFENMIKVHGVAPVAEHLNCIVDLFSRAGRLEEAKKFLLTMPIDPSSSGWRSLLTSCKIHGNMELGRDCFDQAVQLDPGSAAGYVLMTSIYGDAQQWKDMQTVQVLRKRAGVSKKPGTARIELNDKVHEFIVGEKRHSRGVKAYSEFYSLKKRMKEVGYVPHVDAMLEKQEVKLG